MRTCLTGIKSFFAGQHSIKAANKSAKHHLMFTNHIIHYYSYSNDRFHNIDTTTINSRNQLREFRKNESCQIWRRLRISKEHDARAPLILSFTGGANLAPFSRCVLAAPSATDCIGAEFLFIMVDRRGFLEVTHFGFLEGQPGWMFVCVFFSFVTT